jgi:hypothetical protein
MLPQAMHHGFHHGSQFLDHDIVHGRGREVGDFVHQAQQRVLVDQDDLAVLRLVRKAELQDQLGRRHLAKQLRGVRRQRERRVEFHRIVDRFTNGHRCGLPDLILDAV